MQHYSHPAAATDILRKLIEVHMPRNRILKIAASFLKNQIIDRSGLSLWRVETMIVKRLAWITVGIFTLMMLFMFTGCSSTDNSYSQSLGSYRKSQEITNLFNSYQYQPGYKYYYAGFMKDPEGVIGIHSDFQIEEICGRGSRAVHWHEFDTTPQNMEILVAGIELKGKPYGADISDHAGKQVGILYTFEQFEYRPFVRRIEDNSICVIPQYYTGIDWRKGD